MFKHRVATNEIGNYITVINNEKVTINSAVFITNNSERVNTNFKNNFGVWFQPVSKKWTIYNEKRDALGKHEAFNVLSIPFPVTHTTVVKPMNFNKEIKKDVQKIDSTSLKSNTNNQLNKNKAAILRLKNNRSANPSINSEDSEALIQFAMRQSYSSSVSDLKSYASKVKVFNQKKRKLRDKVLEVGDKMSTYTSIMDYVSELKTFKTELILAISEKLNEKHTASNIKMSKAEMKKEFDNIVPLLIKQMTYSYPSYEEASLLGIPNQVPNSDITSIEDLNSEIDFWTKKPQTLNATQDLDTNASLVNIDLQNILQQQQQTFQMIANVSKMLHDSAKANIKNIKN